MLGVLLALVVPLFVAGVALLRVASAGRAGRLPRNGLVGVRTQVTLADDEAWATAQRVAAPSTRGGGVAAIATAVAAGSAGGLGLDAAVVTTVALLGTAVVLAAVVAGAIAGHRAARAAPSTTRS